MRSWMSALAALALATQLAACGGGSSSSGTAQTPTGAQGIATPKAVSVVTAN